MKNRNWKDKIRQIISRSYGFDELSRFLYLVSLALILIGSIFRLSVLVIPSYLLVIYVAYRTFTPPTYKKRQMNQYYLSYRWKFRDRFYKFGNEMRQRRDYHIYRCPKCGQKLRVPRHQGKIEITCPKCKTTFDKRS